MNKKPSEEWLEYALECEKTLRNLSSGDPSVRFFMKERELAISAAAEEEKMELEND